jgi:hypothetical protein
MDSAPIFQSLPNYFSILYDPSHEDQPLSTDFHTSGTFHKLLKLCHRA